MAQRGSHHLVDPLGAIASDGTKGVQSSYCFTYITRNTSKQLYPVSSTIILDQMQRFDALVTEMNDAIAYDVLSHYMFLSSLILVIHCLSYSLLPYSLTKSDETKGGYTT